MPLPGRASGCCRDTRRRHGPPLRRRRITPGQHAGADGAARTWDTATGQELAPLVRPSADPRHVDISRDGSRILADVFDGGVYLWDPVAGSPRSVRDRPPGRALGHRLLRRAGSLRRRVRPRRSPLGCHQRPTPPHDRCCRFTTGIRRVQSGWPATRGFRCRDPRGCGTSRQGSNWPHWQRTPVRGGSASPPMPRVGS